MKRAIIFLLVLIPFLGYGQADSSAIMPVLSDGNVGIMEVMGLDSTVSESEIYARAKLFIAENFKSAKDVIQLDDKENGVLVCRVVTYFGGGMLAAESPLFMDIKIEAKKSKYRYTMYNMTFSDDRISANKLLATGTLFSYSKKQKRQFKEALTNMQNRIKTAMAKPIAAKDF